jgi:mannonate dehydratase
VGHAAQAHIDMAIWNFGIQEGREFSEEERAVFPGSPVMKNGYMHINEAPGYGLDLDEKAAAAFPVNPKSNWQVRNEDGTIIRP